MGILVELSEKSAILEKMSCILVCQNDTLVRVMLTIKFFYFREGSLTKCDSTNVSSLNLGGKKWKKFDKSR